MNVGTPIATPIETLTSRQRVVRAINHQPVDRVPIDLGVHYSTGISGFAYWNLREYLGLSTDQIEICDMVQFLARVDEDILQRFHCDCHLLQAPWVETQRWSPRGKYEFTIPKTVQPLLNAEGDWIVQRNDQSMRMPQGGFFFDGNWPSFESRSWEQAVQATTYEAERIFKETDYATIYIGFDAFFPTDPDSLCRMLTEPDELRADLERRCDSEIARLQDVLDAMGKYIQIICVNADMGTQRGPWCRPSVYEEVCAPPLKRFCQHVHNNSDCKMFLHSCGSIAPIIPALIDCGIDILNPVQISAENMDPSYLKQTFGDKMVFWGGGCNTQQVLGVGTPQDVAANVRELMSVFKPNSGFVFNQVHNIMGNVPPENVVAMLDTAYRESFFPDLLSGV